MWSGSVNIHHLLTVGPSKPLLLCWPSCWPVAAVTDYTTGDRAVTDYTTGDRAVTDYRRQGGD